MSDWVKTTLGEVMTLDLHAVEVNPAMSYEIVGVLNRGRGLLYRGPMRGSETSYKNLNQIYSNQIVYSRLKAFEGAITVAPRGLGPAFASAEFPTFTCGDGMLPDFFRLFTTTQRLWDTMQSLSTGMGGRRERVKPKDFLTIEINLPPLVDQRRIVAVVDAVDRKISATEVEARQLDRILAKMQADIPDSPERPIGDLLLSIDSGKSVRALRDTPVSGKPRILKLSAVRPNSFDASEGKHIEEIAPFSNSHIVHEGDLLITRSNTPDRVGYVAIARNVPSDTYMPDLIWRLRPDTEKVRVDYLEHAFASSLMRARVTATASGTSQSMRKINKAGFSKVLVPVPSLEDQKKYAERCTAVTSSVNRMRTEINRLRAVRSGLVNTLLSREIEVDEALDEFLKEKAA